MPTKKKPEVNKTPRHSKWAIGHGDMIELLKALENKRPLKIGNKMRMLVLILAFLAIPLHSTVADTWTKGDIVNVFFMCIEEKDIMDIAYADSKSELRYASTLKIKQFDNKCNFVAPPIVLNISNVIGSYKDHKEKETSILKLHDPKTNLKAGYIIAEGRPASAKEMSH